MKKYLILGVLILLPLVSKAQTQIFGFMNGNFYNLAGDLKYACLMDGNCYDYSTQQIISLSQILGLSSSTPQTIIVTSGLPTSTPTTTIQTPTPQPIPPPQLQQLINPIITPMTNARIEIVSPIGTKGLGRSYLARADIKDEFNYVSIGAIIYNDDGSINRTDEMVITATDATQNKTLEGTGDLWANRYVNGEKQPAYYYTFDYQFKTTGDHTITFTAGALTQSVTINVPADDTRP